MMFVDLTYRLLSLEVVLLRDNFLCKSYVYHDIINIKATVSTVLWPYIADTPVSSKVHTMVNIYLHSTQAHIF